ncbi:MULTISPECIES: 50S ribosomal protein L24 [Croceimicrobium]|uniref:Large ribosomal subunit protein uL24 n=1 Tax=Croceimicrobium hydrocarbonivorans TaxID=2761580 RepID=A0A7H0VCA0_9FLAO|nr:50S ribosomal protein L24 [Croceimicrobium hydrocarbonivorans]QNR23348.1 50S ribosomal protein L24 [Croceimicrobium hydrocarbonivorans]
MAKFHIKKGDKVVVLSGEDKGKEGTVLEMLPKKGKAIVEGINVVKKHKKPSATDPQGGIEEVEAPVYLSKLMLIDPANGEPTRVGRKADENGKLVRYSKKTQEIIK